MSTNWTTRFRVWFVVLFSAVVLSALAGWLQGSDPTQLGPVLAWSAAALGIGEAANVGKRATYRPEA